jgi:alcohol dehydrogenase (cytochrome c)
MSPHRRINLRNMVLASAIVPVFTAIGQAPREASAPVAAAVPVILQNYKNVTTARLRKPEDDDWLMIRRTWDGQGYSPLDQITPSNVSNLRPAWVFSTGVNSGHESAALVNNGVMFVSTPGNQVLAIDAKTGLLLWRYRRRLPDDVVLMHPTSRGVALYGDKVYFCAGDAVLVAIDAKTGKEVWSTKTAVNKDGYYMSLAPQVADGRILIGTSGGEWGIRGFIAAFDPESGKELWRTFTVPAPGEVGSESWPKGDQWKTGGGPIWVTGNYDPETNLAYWGVGNGGPWMGDQRPGDNLYTSSTIAIDVSTGTIKGHHQYHPNDSWDWDEVSPPILVDYKRGGKTIKGLIDVARDGYLWFLERASGQINYVEGKPYVHQDVFKSLDPKTGRPDVDPEHKPGTGKTVSYCPSVWGGKNWPPAAFSPKTRLLYIPANENLCTTSSGVQTEYEAGRIYMGARTILTAVPGADHFGEVQAWNVDTGERAWTHNYTESPNWGPMLATGGGLVFSGGTNDRKFHAFDAATGKLLWEFPTNSGILGQPTSFSIDGKQYISVESGWGVDSRSLQAGLNRIFPGRFPEIPEGGAIWVFELK